MSLIANKYKLLEKIGSGSFGTIYKGENIRSREKVAIKVEPIMEDLKLLKNESTIYQYLKEIKGVPSIKWYGKDEDNYYMVISLLGESLQKIKDNYGFFSKKIVFQLGVQLLEILKSIHNKGLIHRDIKPDNFLIGPKNKTQSETQLYLIDFGFCKTYLNGDKHIEQKSISKLLGTPNYASVNAHNCINLSRRDDLESLGYMLIYFYLGDLPWKNEENIDSIKHMKDLLLKNKDIPNTLIHYLKIVRGLEFEETPNYIYLLDILKNESMHL